MSDDSKGEARDFEALLREMPRIAEAVNSFTDAAVQQQALEALVASFRSGGTAGGAAERQDPAPTASRQARKRAPKSGEDGKTKQRRTGGPKQIKELDFTPRGKPSLADFVTEKQPKSQDDKNAVSVYWLIEHAGVTPVSIDHVYTCYRDQGWPLPTDMANRLALTASRKRFLNTSDYEDIRLTPTGTNHVEHKLPPKKGEK
jgi:hypothetical protein